MHFSWQGPLCAAPDESESGLLKFEPLYRRCVVDQIPPHLLLSYKNVSVVSWLQLLRDFKSQNFYFIRLSTGISRMAIRCKHAVKIWVFTNSSAKRKFSARMDCGLQSFRNASQRLSWRIILMTAHPRSESKLAWDRQRTNHLAFSQCFQRRLFILTACIRDEKAAPNGLGRDGSVNISQVIIFPRASAIAMTSRFPIVSIPIHRTSLQPVNIFLTRRLECRSRRESDALPFVD